MKSPPVGAVSLVIEHTDLLYAAYMPYLTNGGLFIATDKAYHLGDTLHVNWSLAGERCEAFIGRVVWITPDRSQGNRAVGVGIAFPTDKAGRLKEKIERLLGARLASDDDTHTV